MDAFGKPFVAYRFQVRYANLEWNLAKRFSDFAALHDRLRSAKADDPSLRAAVPPLPPRWPKPSSDEAVEERRLQLEGYLQGLVNLPGAIENPHVLTFLGIMNARTELPLDDPLQPGRKRQVGQAGRRLW